MDEHLLREKTAQEIIWIADNLIDYFTTIKKRAQEDKSIPNLLALGGVVTYFNKLLKDENTFADTITDHIREKMNELRKN